MWRWGTVEMLFWPPKDFHKLTKHWDFGPALLSGCLFSPDIELRETVWLWLLFSAPWGRGGDGFARALCSCPEPDTGET